MTVDDSAPAIPARPAGLERDSAALAVSAAGTAALGLIYWVVVGRLYPAAEVGAAAAVITAATMLSAFGNLGLGAYFERFLPVAGPARRRLALTGLLVGAGGGLLLGSAFLLLGPVDEMFGSTGEQLLFPLFVVVLSTFALLDHLVIAMHRARLAAVKNLSHALIKLLCAAAVAGLLGRIGITGTWVLTALLCGAVAGATAFRLLRAQPQPAPADLPAPAEQLRFVTVNYGVYVVTALAPLILPMLVIARVGADQNAYFAIVWSLVTAVTVLLTMLMGPYVAAVAATPERIRELSARFAGILLGISVAAAAGLAAVGPLFLRLAGSDYAEHGGRLLQTAALALPAAAVALGFTALCRVRRRLWPALLVQLVSASLMLGLTADWLDEHGLMAAAWALLVAEGTAAVLVAVPLWRAWRSFPATATTADGAGPRTGQSTSS